MKINLLVYTLLLLPNIFFAAKGHVPNLVACGWIAGMMLDSIVQELRQVSS